MRYLLFTLFLVTCCISYSQSRAKERVDTGPAWSSDGNLIGFSSFRDGNYEIYQMKTDGSEITRLTNNQVDDHYPTWSNDGKWMTYSSKVNGEYDVFIRSTDGGSPINLTNHPSRDGGEYCSWSPDNLNILFTSNRDGAGEIYQLDVRTREFTNLSQHNANDMMPSYSPSGKWIAFSSAREGGTSIFIMDEGGENVKRITNGKLDLFSSWSPDEKKLVFQRRDTEGFTFYTINVDGTNETKLSDEVRFYPRWSPDGSSILYMSPKDGDEEIYIQELVTNEVRQLTEN